MHKYLTFYCCWRRSSCQQYESVHCWYGKATLGSLCTVAELLLLTIMRITYYVCESLFLRSYSVWISPLFSALLYYHPWPVWLYNIFPHYLINGPIFVKNILNIKYVFWFSVQLLSEMPLILRGVQRDSVTNVHISSYKVPVILVKF